MVTPVRTSSALLAPGGMVQQLWIFALSASISFWVIAVSAVACDEPTVAGLSEGAAGGGVSLLVRSAVILSSKFFFGSVGGVGGRGRMRGNGGAADAVFTAAA